MESYRMVQSGAEAETVDVGEVARTVRRSWRGVGVGALVGLLVGAALVLFFPPMYSGRASVLLRNANDPAGSLLSRFGLPGDLGSGAGGGGALGNVFKSPMETELQILGSGDVLGHVIDSLGLQARVLAPRSVPSRALLVPRPYAGSFRRQRFAFERRPDGAYEIRGADTTVVARPGQSVRLPVVGSVTLATGSLPERFRVQFEDRADAIRRLEARLDVEKSGGEVAEIDYSGPDSLTAAEVPNALIEVYLQRRRTTDRGLNQRRYEFLSAQADTVAVALREAENALRGQQEASGVFDPEMSGKAEYEGLHLVREQLAAIESERVAIANVLSEVERGRLTERQLAAFPSLLRSPAVNTILSQMSSLETERTRLLERRTARDPEVVVLTQSIAELERQLLPIARAYSTSLTSQSNELRREERAVESRLARLPGQAEGNLRAQRDVKRLSQTMLALQAQILDARLAAVSEGGQVRQVDVALPPKKIWFPRPLPTLVVSAILGLLAGIVWAIARGAMSSRVRTPVDAERASSLPALDWAPGRPLLLGAVGRTGTLLVVPVGEDRGAAEAVARQLLEHAAEREQRAALVDLSADVTESAPGAAARLVGAAEHSHPFVVVATPGFADRRTSAVLEPPRGTLLVALTGVSRGELGEAVGTVARLGMPCLGLVLVDREQLAAGARRLGRGHDVAVRRSAPADEGVLTARSNGARG